MNAKKLGLVFFPAFDWAISPTHPERQERLLYTRDQIVEEGLLDMPAIKEYRPKLASISDIERVHIGVPNISSLIKDAHLVSAGGAIAAADAVMKGEVARAFALVRPPGHHAMRMVYGTRGFCTINIEAIMIEYLRKNYGIKKVAIIDTDVHHGDGTQDIFYHDPDTLFISFHQDGRTLYPGTGFTNELGSPMALGTTLNIPLPPGTGDAGLHQVLDHLILPVLDDFQPEIIINSAGQDNHYSDPLANMAITAQGYAKMADKLKADIAVLEGGYSIENALPYVNVGIILAMAQMNYEKALEPDIDKCPIQSASVDAYINEMIKERLDMWKKREILKNAAIKETEDFWRQKRAIYYDDSDLETMQTDSVRMCPNCLGYLTIASTARGGYGFGQKSAFAAVITKDNCPSCRADAYDDVRRAKMTGKYDWHFVQDKAHDIIEKL